MKTWLAALAVVVTASIGVPLEAEAKRLGGGKSQGMQRNSAPEAPAKANPGAPAQQGAAPAAAGTPAAATAAAPAAATAAAAGKRSWLGPIAGIAAGLGLVALMSSLGLGEEFANFLMLALLAVAAIALVAFLMRRFGRNAVAPRGPQLAAAGGVPMGGFERAQPAPSEPMARTSLAPAPLIGSALGAAAVSAQGSPLVPADFDTDGFERIARTIFVRMQDAHDRGDLDDLRNFTTPELFANLRVDLLERGDVASVTDVVAVEAHVIEVAEDNGRQIVSVAFTGSAREEAGAEPVAFDEIWHLVRPADGSRNWAIAGIQQRS